MGQQWAGAVMFMSGSEYNGPGPFVLVAVASVTCWWAFAVFIGGRRGRAEAQQQKLEEMKP